MKWRDDWEQFGGLDHVNVDQAEDEASGDVEFWSVSQWESQRGREGGSQMFSELRQRGKREMSTVDVMMSNMFKEII